MTIGAQPALPIFQNLLAELNVDVGAALYSCSYIHNTYEVAENPIENLMTVPPSPPCPDLDDSFDAALEMLRNI